jgi:hypothetical protein
MAGRLYPLPPGEGKFCMSFMEKWITLIVHETGWLSDSIHPPFRKFRKGGSETSFLDTIRKEPVEGIQVSSCTGLDYIGTGADA